MQLGLNKNSWFFAVKTTLAALLAMFISFNFDLNNPSWAVATVFIASQPFSSSTFSKGMYRIIGTFCGALVSLFLVPHLVQEPIALSLALAFWVSFCLYISLQDRSPRSYMFMLAGYTACIISFPSVATPENIFTTAVDRFQEILIGVISSAVVHSTLFPNNIFNAVKGTIDKWIVDAYQLIGVSFAGKKHGEGTGYDLLHNVANYPLNLERLADHLVYDGRKGRKQAELVENIQTNMRQLVPIVDSIYYRISLLENHQIPEHIDDIFKKIQKWQSNPNNLEEFQQIKADLQVLRGQYLKQYTDEKNVALYALIIRLQELIHFMHKVNVLQKHLHQDVFDKHDKPLKKHYFVDQSLALLSAFTVFITIMFTNLLWIYCGWDTNSSAMPMMAAISCSLFATFDSALPPLKIFFRATVISVVIVIFYTVMVLPSVNSYEMVVLVTAPTFMALALFMTVPNTAFISMILAINLASLLGLKNEYHGDFLATLNGGLASVLGIGIAIFMMSTLRTKSPIWVARQIEKYALKDIISTVKRLNSQKNYWKNRENFINRMLDKIYQLLPRIRNANTRNLYQDTKIMQDIRLGINLLDLKVFSLENKNPEIKQQIDDLIEQIIFYLKSRIDDNSIQPPHVLKSYIDALNIAHQGLIEDNEITVVLYNIEISLFGQQVLKDDPDTLNNSVLLAEV